MLQGRDVNHSPSGAEITNEWNYTSSPPYRYGQGELYVYLWCNNVAIYYSQSHNMY